MKPDIIPRSIAEALTVAWDMRQDADYDALTVFDEHAAEDLIRDVTTFVDAVEEMLNSEY